MTIEPLSAQELALIKAAAELARGPNLDERFDLDNRLPKWVRRNIERICDRQRELCCIIRDNADKLKLERDALAARLEKADLHIRDMHWFANRAEPFEHDSKPCFILQPPYLSAILKVSETYPEAWRAATTEAPK